MADRQTNYVQSHSNVISLKCQTSCLVTVGRTKVICTASIDEDVPRWMKGRGTDGSPLNIRCFPGRRQSVLIAAAQESSLDARSKFSGSSHEHFGPCDMSLLGERQVVVDCDVIQADGGARTASICGGYLALHGAYSTGAARSHRVTSVALHVCSNLGWHC